MTILASGHSFRMVESHRFHLALASQYPWWWRLVFLSAPTPPLLAHFSPLRLAQYRFAWTKSFSIPIGPFHGRLLIILSYSFLFIFLSFTRRGTRISTANSLLRTRSYFNGSRHVFNTFLNIFSTHNSIVPIFPAQSRFHHLPSVNEVVFLPDAKKTSICWALACFMVLLTISWTIRNRCSSIFFEILTSLWWKTTVRLLFSFNSLKIISIPSTKLFPSNSVGRRCRSKTR